MRRRKINNNICLKQEKDVGILKGDTNMEEKIVVVLNEMAEYLSIAQMKKLQEVIIKTFAENEANKTGYI